MENIRPIRTEEDYDWAIAEVGAYFENEPAQGSPEGDRFLVLLDLIAAYEDRHYPISAPDPVTLIDEYLRATGKKQAALAAIIGSKSRASEILHRKRRLSIEHVHAITEAWPLPAEALVRPYHLAGETGKAKVRGAARSD
jgi:HTH-type transcriptional regulator/antitoxin HigA